jgi:hypothetical protein
VKSKQFSSVESWDKVAGEAHWVSGQSQKINPGSEKAIARRRNSKRYHARSKKVIRPRIRKHQTPKEGDGR